MKFNKLFFAAPILIPQVSASMARTFTVHNACSFTIWPAIFTDLNAGSSIPKQNTGWEAASQSQVQFIVPSDWKAGRIWGRRDCSFDSSPARRNSNTTDDVFMNVDKLSFHAAKSNNISARDDSGPNSCISGGCNGGLLCDPHTGGGVPPVTLAEFTLSGDSGLDYFDVSLVDGFNLPLRITNDKGCPIADCPVDLNANCPSELKGPLDSNGANLGCKSSCLANIDGTPADSANCCTGSHNTPATCPSSGVAEYSYFKQGCPNSYAYAYDEASGKALYTCASNLNTDYTVTFCP